MTPTLITRGMSHHGLAIYIKKYYESYSNISSCKNIMFQKSSKSNQNPSRDYITL
jgi:lipoate-protein ligase B